MWAMKLQFPLNRKNKSIMRNNYKQYVVRYWNHYTCGCFRPINDCWGNSISWVGKARTTEEALRKAKYKNSIHNLPFRLQSIRIKE